VVIHNAVRVRFQALTLQDCFHAYVQVEQQHQEVHARSSSALHFKSLSIMSTAHFHVLQNVQTTQTQIQQSTVQHTVH
jgi:hypothetical protein